MEENIPNLTVSTCKKKKNKKNNNLHLTLYLLGEDWMLPPKTKNRQKGMVSPLLFNIMPEDLASAISQVKEINAYGSERKKENYTNITDE